MSTTSTLTEAAERLFADYPQAASIEAVSRYGADRSMTVAVFNDDEPRFFIVGRDVEPDGPLFTVRQRRTTDVACLSDETIPLPGWAADAVTCGLPIPPHGALYGWADRGRITAMIPFYGDGLEPGSFLMPEADAADWPPFAGEKVLGPWLWEYYRAGRIVNLGPVIAGSPGAVFWTAGVAPLEWGCCAVARDLASPDGWTFPSGRYVYGGELQAGVAVPSLETLLADPGATDLAPRFATPAGGGQQ